MRLHRRASVLLVALATALVVSPAVGRAETEAPAQPAPPPATESAEAPKAPEVAEVITRCLHDGREIFMSRDAGAKCVNRGSGSGQAQQTGMPHQITDLATACRDLTDQRRLPPDVIKRVVDTAREKALPIAPTGIRIIGALFCTEPDLVGVDLPYSLVLDYMATPGRVFGRNIQIRGDLSIDHSFVKRAFLLTRGRINGSVYAESSVVGRVGVFDSTVQGSWHQPGSMIFGTAEFRGLSLSGDLDLSESALSMLSVRSAQINGGLILNKSEARCAYHIRGSSLGYVLGESAGFGAMTYADTIDNNPAQPRLTLPWWFHRLDKPTPAQIEQMAPHDRPTVYTNMGLRAETPLVQAALAELAAQARETDARRRDAEAKRGPATKGLTEAKLLPGCVELSQSKNAEFYFLNNRVQSTVCLRSFNWLRPRESEDQKVTVLSLNGTSVTGNLIIDLWGDRPDRLREALTQPETRILEAIGVSMAALIFDFRDNARPYVTYLDGLKFNQVHTASVNCEFQRDQEGSSAANPNAPNGGVLRQPSLPSVQDVMQWLEKNGSRSSQPFSAFVEAFEHAGADASDLKIARRTADLCVETARWLTVLKCQKGSSSATQRPKAPADNEANAPAVSEASVLEQAWSLLTAIPLFLTLIFQWTLFAVAGHGIRPGWAVWWVIGVLGVFLILFWIILGIVGFDPKEKTDENDKKPKRLPEPWPVTVLFLFDRLLPLYKIREEHYSIARYYRLATDAEIEAGVYDPTQQPAQMRYLFWNLPVMPATDPENRRAEKVLLILRVIGLVLTVFLLAAINALTR